MQATMTTFPHLQDQQYMSLTTYRKNGDAVPTPVWFAQVDDKLYVFSDATAGKIKRIRHTARVSVAPCTANGKITGTAQEAVARILSDDQARLALDAIDRKYGWQKRSLDAMSKVVGMFRRSEGEGTLYLEISPA